jgi:PleD family two-component response regulator
MTGRDIQGKTSQASEHIGTEMLCHSPSVPGESRFSGTVHPMILDLSCIPAVVLIVEDEMILRMFAVDMVEDAGYTPVETVDADEAIAVLESRSDIALMCTDVQMPGSIDGLELARTVHER